LSGALDAADLVDPRQGEERLGDRDSSRPSTKDGKEVTERDPEEEEQHRERSGGNKCLLDLSPALTAKRATKQECSNATTIERWDREQVQDCKICGEECGNLKESAKAEPLSRPSNTDRNANGP
jgi:hypothetical protein